MIDQNAPGSNREPLPRQDQFLLQLYMQLWNSINIHIQVVWQSVAVMITAFGALAVVSRDASAIDFVVTLIVSGSAWLAAHALNAGYWYRQNLFMVQQIERHFLGRQASQFIPITGNSSGQADSGLKMPTYVRTQIALAGSIVATVLAFHFSIRVWPGIGSPIQQFELSRSLPYVAFALAVALLIITRNHLVDDYAKIVHSINQSQVET